MQLANGPFDIQSTLSCLFQATQKARLQDSTVKADRRGSFLAQFDATRDMKGFFYSYEPIKDKYGQLKTLLEEGFGVKLRNNGNTFSTCFQFVEQQKEHTPYRRIKVYNKTLVVFQSDSVKKTVGMNTNALFAPYQRMLKAFNETLETGLSRIEISYYADSHLA